jgi:hypothetical protein
MSQCDPGNCNHSSHVTEAAGATEAAMEVKAPAPIETVGLAQVNRAPSPSEKFIAKAAAKVLPPTPEPDTDHLEVKQVAPIEADTPDQIIARLRAQLEEARADATTAVRLADHWKGERDISRADLEKVQKTMDSVKKRIGEACEDRDRWQTKAKNLQTQVDGQKAERLVALIDERQKLRTDLGQKDKRIAELAGQVAQAETSRGVALARAQQAEQRFAGLEASVEVIQRARDKYHGELAFADGVVKEVGMVLQKLGTDLSKTPPMLYADAIKFLYATWNRKTTALETQVASLLERLPKPTTAPAPARKGA